MADEGKDISEGGPLMDPFGETFQKMLAHGKAGREQGENPASPAEPTKKPKPVAKEEAPHEEEEPEAEQPDEEKATGDDEDSDDVETLKRRLGGLKAELTKVRKQRTSASDEGLALRERIASLEGEMKAFRAIDEKKAQDSIESKLQGLGDEQLTDARIAWEDERADARALARLAERDGDREAVQEANKRISDANHMLKLYAVEQDRRTSDKVFKKEAANKAEFDMKTELDALVTSSLEIAPELGDQNSKIWKAAKAEYDKSPKLMSQLGAIGELFAFAQAVLKNPDLISRGSKTKVDNVLDDLEKATTKSFRSSNAPRVGASKQDYSIHNARDLADFEAEVLRMKRG